jgi:hypothetical protein
LLQKKQEQNSSRNGRKGGIKSLFTSEEKVELLSLQQSVEDNGFNEIIDVMFTNEFIESLSVTLIVIIAMLALSF